MDIFEEKSILYRTWQEGVISIFQAPPSEPRGAEYGAGAASSVRRLSQLTNKC